MPAISRWFIKTGIGYLLLSLLLGIGMAWPGNAPIGTWFSSLFPTYYHILAVGWITEIIFGVAYWMFPRYSKEKPRGHEMLAWITYGCINTGLILRIILEPVLSSHQTIICVEAGLVISAVLQWLAAVLFVTNTWSRVKGRK